MVSRTQARQIQTHFQLDAPRLLATIPCGQCGAIGVSILAMGVNDSGAIERAFCGHPCAKLNGWPWISSIEKKRRK
jgi:hypothetical protein